MGLVRIWDHTEGGCLSDLSMGAARHLNSILIQGSSEYGASGYFHGSTQGVRGQVLVGPGLVVDVSVTCGYSVFGVGTAPDLKWPWRHTGNAENSQRQDEGPVGKTPGTG